MDVPPRTRASHVIHFTNFLRDVGAPVSREIIRANLPPAFEEDPDCYILECFALDFLTSCQSREGIDDLGFRAGWQLRYEHLGLPFRAAAQAATTLKQRLDIFDEYAQLENSNLRFVTRRNGDAMQVIAVHERAAGTDTRISEWVQLKAIIEVVRTACGPDYLPPVISFRARFVPCDSVLAELGDLLILTDQPTTSVNMPLSVLAKHVSHVHHARSNDHSPAGEIGGSDSNSNDDSLAHFCSLIKPYLTAGEPSIGLASEILGTNVRRLQRLLASHNTNYRAVLNRLRTGRAAALLENTDMKIIDVAIDVGYENATHFTRSFKKASGLTPSEYRLCRGNSLTR